MGFSDCKEMEAHLVSRVLDEEGALAELDKD